MTNPAGAGAGTGFVIGHIFTICTIKFLLEDIYYNKYLIKKYY